MKHFPILPSGMLRINLCGPMCSGKGHLAEYLCKSFNLMEVAFSDALYERVARNHNTSVERIKDNKGQYRAELQEVGHSEVQKDKLYWVKELEQRIINTTHYWTKGYVESGTRYEHELAAWESMGSITVKVNTPDEIRLERYFNKYKRYPTDAEFYHPVEVGIADLLVHVIVDGTQTAEHNAEVIRAYLRGTPVANRVRCLR